MEQRGHRQPRHGGQHPALDQGAHPAGAAAAVGHPAPDQPRCRGREVEHHEQRARLGLAEAVVARRGDDVGERRAERVDVEQAHHQQRTHAARGQRAVQPHAPGGAAAGGRQPREHAGGGGGGEGGHDQGQPHAADVGQQRQGGRADGAAHGDGQLAPAQGDPAPLRWELAQQAAHAGHRHGGRADAGQEDGGGEQRGVRRDRCREVRAEVDGGAEQEHRAGAEAIDQHARGDQRDCGAEAHRREHGAEPCRTQAEHVLDVHADGGQAELHDGHRRLGDDGDDQRRSRAGGSLATRYPGLGECMLAPVSAIERTRCPICAKGHPLDVIAELDTTWVSAPPVAVLPGYACVVARRHVEEPFQVCRTTRSVVFWRESMGVARASVPARAREDELRDPRQLDPAPAPSPVPALPGRSLRTPADRDGRPRLHPQRG